MNKLLAAVFTSCMFLSGVSASAEDYPDQDGELTEMAEESDTSAEIIEEETDGQNIEENLTESENSVSAENYPDQDGELTEMTEESDASAEIIEEETDRHNIEENLTENEGAADASEDIFTDAAGSESVAETEDVIPEVVIEYPSISYKQVPDSDLDYSYVYDETVSVYYAEADDTSELQKLDNPFDLEWGKYYTGKNGEGSVIEAPGNAAFSPPELTQNYYNFALYNTAGEKIYSCGLNTGTHRSGDHINLSYHLGERVLETGDYYFTVQSRGDDKEYSDSDVISSSVWHYEKPENSLPVINDVKVEGRDIIFDLGESAGKIAGYYVEIYYSKESGENKNHAGATVNFNPNQDFSKNTKVTASIYDSCLQRCGPGYYSARVRLISKNINETASSELSPMSNEYNIANIAETMEIEYKDLLQKSDDENLSAQEIREAAQKFDREELATAMLTDRENTAVVKVMEELEQKLGGSEIVVNDDMKSVFEESDMKVFGATLNTPENAEENIKLVVDKPKYDDVIPPLYNSTVAVKFSMELENVENTDELKVPVKIVLPVPETINPDFMAILHYHVAGGEPEYIKPAIIEQNGRKYASFVLTSFSDFIITTTEKDEEKITFSDVTDPSEFYYDYVYDMAEKGVVQGYNDGTFRPYNDCNRAAVVTFLWRLMGKPEPAGTSKFSDPTGTEDFDKAISWAAEKGITTGWDDNTFRPWVTCNRAAVVTFLWRAAGKPEPQEAASFSDMTGNEDFDKAISWAAENGITTGWEEDNTFRPWRTCNRLAIVSFLSRYEKLQN